MKNTAGLSISSTFKDKSLYTLKAKKVYISVSEFLFYFSLQIQPTIPGSKMISPFYKF
jgi:hypothetical protein